MNGDLGTVSVGRGRRESGFGLVNMEGSWGIASREKKEERIEEKRCSGVGTSKARGAPFRETNTVGKTPVHVL